jgi:hypothetical protein
MHTSEMQYGSVKTLFLMIKYMGYVWADIKHTRQLLTTQTTAIIITIIIIIFSGSAAQRGLWPSCSQGFVITHDAPLSVGLLWMSDQLITETSS